MVLGLVLRPIRHLVYSAKEFDVALCLSVRPYSSVRAAFTWMGKRIQLDVPPMDAAKN